eukprot:m51a1_g2955 hypothetical protein (312) ;mRNA; r:655455-657272
MTLAQCLDTSGYYVDLMETNGTTVFIYATPRIGKYVIGLYNTSDYVAYDELCWTTVEVTTTNTLTAVTPEESRRGGVVIGYTASPRHSLDRICVCDAETATDMCSQDSTGVECTWLERETAMGFSLADYQGSSVLRASYCVDTDETFTTNISHSESPSLYLLGSDVVALSGSDVDIPVVVTTGNPEALDFFITSPLNGMSFARDDENVSVYHLLWSTWGIEAQEYFVEFWAVDGNGLMAGPTSVFIDIRQQYCEVWGDPHFVTFDNLSYDFQGFGEYTFLSSTVPTWLGDQTVNIQGRTDYGSVWDVEWRP